MYRFLLLAGIGISLPSGPGPYQDVDTQGDAVRESRLHHIAAAIEFEPGEATLTDAARGTLAQLLANARGAGALGTVHVAAWSDKAFPSRSSESLSAGDLMLAESRLAATRDYLKANLNVPIVTTYNLARGATKLAIAFNTADAEAKRIVAGEEAAPAVGERVELLRFRDLGGPSRAVIVVEHELAPASH